MRTYVIRVQDSRTLDAQPDALRGVAEEIATGRHLTFTSGAELLRLLAAPDFAAHADAINTNAAEQGVNHSCQ